eukprot:UN02527
MPPRESTAGGTNRSTKVSSLGDDNSDDNNNVPQQRSRATAPQPSVSTPQQQSQQQETRVNNQSTIGYQIFFLLAFIGVLMLAFSWSPDYLSSSTNNVDLPPLHNIEPIPTPESIIDIKDTVTDQVSVEKEDLENNNTNVPILIRFLCQRYVQCITVWQVI